MKKIGRYYKDQKSSIYNYFGYDGVELPILKKHNDLWTIDGNEIEYVNIKPGKNGHKLSVGTFKDKYIGRDYTMFIMTSDSGDYIAVFDNNKDNDNCTICPDCSEIITIKERSASNCWSCGSDFRNLRV